MAEILNIDEQKNLVKDLANPKKEIKGILEKYGITYSDYNYYRNKLKPLIEEYIKLEDEKEKEEFALNPNIKSLRSIWNQLEELLMYRKFYPEAKDIEEVEKEIDNLTILYAQTDIGEAKEIEVPPKLELQY